MLTGRISYCDTATIRFRGGQTARDELGAAAHGRFCGAVEDSGACRGKSVSLEQVVRRSGYTGFIGGVPDKGSTRTPLGNCQPSRSKLRSAHGGVTGSRRGDGSASVG